MKVPDKVWEVRFCRFFFEKWYFFHMHNTKILIEVIFLLFLNFSELTLYLLFLNSGCAPATPDRASEQKASTLFLQRMEKCTQIILQV